MWDPLIWDHMSTKLLLLLFCFFPSFPVKASLLSSCKLSQESNMWAVYKLQCKQAQKKYAMFEYIKGNFESMSMCLAAQLNCFPISNSFIHVAMTCINSSWEKTGGRSAFMAPSQAMPINTHNSISSQLLGTRLAKSAALSTLPLGKPFTLSPERGRGKNSICYRSELEAW